MKDQLGEINYHLVLTIFFGIGTVLFGVLAVLAYRDNSYIHQNLDGLVSTATTKARTDQKSQDDAANKKANEQPYRTFTATPQDGSFQLSIPKTWSVYTASNDNGQTQLDLLADPDAVRQKLVGVNTHALHLQILRESQSDVIQNYSDLLKKHLLTSKGLSVSGISAVWMQGQIDKDRHNGVVVVLPVRDKTMVISTESNDYLSEFNSIINQAKIYP